ncbi:MAG TPA: hypothetical protein VMR21_05760 [Vicinamibacteria bacterium]|nr:hypothetical protein [Vicinamibacteria bacterium]
MDCEAFREDMLDVLYGEGGEEPARRFGEHQAACPECRREIAHLRRLRGDLARWRLPEPVATPAERPARRFRLPFGLAAAAALAALGTFVLGTELRYDRDGFAVRLGRPERSALVREEARRQREEIAALRAEVAELRSAGDARVLHTVAEMIRESEMRQADAREASLREIKERADAQRRYDLARMSAGLAYLDGKAGLQAARTTELVGHLFQVSQQK